MQCIPISLAAAGMILAQDIVTQDDAARILCGKGVTLTESLISRLENMGIKSLLIKGDPLMGEKENTVDDQLAALDARFRLVDNDPLMQKVKEIYRRRICKESEVDNDQPAE